LNKKVFFHISIIVLLLWPTYLALKIGDLPGLSLDRFMILGVAVIFMLNLTSNHRYIQNLKSHGKIVLLLLITFFWNILSSFMVADNVLVSFFASINWFLSGPFLALFVLIIYEKEVDLIKLVSSMVIAIIVINIFGLIEFIKGDLLFKDYLFTVNEYTMSAIIEKTRNGMFRIRSVFSNPLVYAQVLVASIPLFLYVLKTKKIKIVKLFLLINIGLSYFLLYYTGSRAGLALGLAIPFIFFHLNLYKKPWYRLISKIVFFISVPLFLFYLYSVVGESFAQVDDLHEQNMRGELDENTLSTLARVLQYKFGMEAIVHSPIIGYGFGEAVKAIIPLKIIDNYYLTILLSTGIVGFAIFAYFLYVIINQGFKNIRVYKDVPSVYLITSFIIMLMYYMVLSIDKANNLLFLIAAMIFVRTKLQKQQHVKRMYK